MKILTFNADISLPDMYMRRATPYVMADPIANDLAKEHKKNLYKYEVFEPHYFPYVGQNLDGKKLIIWRTGGFGDLLFLTPVVKWLKKKYPTCKISVATSERFKDIWTNNPNIDHVGSCFTLPLSMQVVRKNDYVGIFEGSIEKWSDLEQPCAIDSFAYILGVFDMPTEYKKPEYYLTSSDINATRNKSKYDFGVDIHKDPYVCFQWKSSSIVRDYPYQKLLLAMYKLQKETGYKVLILGHPLYKNMVNIEVDFFNKFGLSGPVDFSPINLCGELPFRKSAALLAHSAGLVGVDSALTHLAAAFGVPSVSLYGPFKAEWRTPYYMNNISLQHQELCEKAPCAYHVPPGRDNTIPFELCSDYDRLPQHKHKKFCRVLEGISTDEIVSSLVKLIDLQKKNELPIERQYKCIL